MRAPGSHRPTQVQSSACPLQGGNLLKGLPPNLLDHGPRLSRGSVPPSRRGDYRYSGELYRQHADRVWNEDGEPNEFRRVSRRSLSPRLPSLKLLGSLNPLQQFWDFVKFFEPQKTEPQRFKGGF